MPDYPFRMARNSPLPRNTPLRRLSVIDRVRHPNTPPKDRDLGPANAQRHAWVVMRRTVEEQLIYAAALHRREVMR